MYLDEQDLQEMQVFDIIVNVGNIWSQMEKSVMSYAVKCTNQITYNSSLYNYLVFSYKCPCT